MTGLFVVMSAGEECAENVAQVAWPARMVYQGFPALAFSALAT